MFSTEFLITSLIVVLIPGTGVIYTISTGLFQGAKASLFATLGCTLGIVPHLLASVFGIAAVMHLSSVGFQIIKFAGVCYLAYLAWSMWRETGALNIAADNASTPQALNRLEIVTRGFLINILNPKLSIFFLAFLPQFVSNAAINPESELLILSGAFMLMTFFVFVIYGLLAHKMSEFVLRSDKIMRITQRSFAATFALLGVKLAFTDR